MTKPTIAVFSGPRATITNAPPLVTSNKARTEGEGSRPRFDHLVPQRLSEPVTVKIDAQSGHPLEREAAEVYHGEDGSYEVTLRPEDGLYLLPYMARRDDGSADGTPFEPDDLRDPSLDYGGRQFFYPDAARVFEEIDRTVYGRTGSGTGNALSRRAEFDFVRVLPPGGYPSKGEALGEDYFPYEPKGKSRSPRIGELARIVNEVQGHLDAGQYDGAIWLEGSARLEETTYWLNLLLDTELPVVGVAANRKHGTLSNDGGRNIVDAVDYLVSGKGNGLGVVCLQDQLIYAARAFSKADARPGGFESVGGYGGILGSVKRRVQVHYAPTYKHTTESAVAITKLPREVSFLDYADDRTPTSVTVKTASGALKPAAIPKVSIIKDSSYSEADHGDDPEAAVDIMARIEEATGERGAAPVRQFYGLVFEGSTPYAGLSASQSAATELAAFSGLPVVRVARGDPGGFVPPDTRKTSPTVVGSNLGSNKAKLLLVAAMLRLGRLPKARDPEAPTEAERAALREGIDRFQALFDTH